MMERLSRRDFLRLTSLAAIGAVAGCKPPKPPEIRTETSIKPSPSLEPKLTNTPPEPTLVKKITPQVGSSPTIVASAETPAPKPTDTLKSTVAPTTTQTREATKTIVKPTMTSFPTRKPTSQPEIATPESTPKPPAWIEVDLSDQKLIFRGDEVREFIVSTGRLETPTVKGTYEIFIKLEDCDMRGPGYFLKDVPYCMYFCGNYGLHGTYWHDNFGTPMSHGCVNLRTEDAKWIYDHIKIGTKVWIHE